MSEREQGKHTAEESALARIDADMVRAAKAADRFERSGKVNEAYRALGIAEGLRSAASILRAALSKAGGSDV